MSINTWTFSGRLGRDAEARYSQSGKEVVSTSVAVDQGWGENKKTLWVDAVMFGERFGKIAQYLVKGVKVTITGEASLNRYATKDGEEKSSIQCIVRDIDFGGEKSGGGQGHGQGNAQTRQQKSQPKNQETRYDPLDDESIPF